MSVTDTRPSAPWTPAPSPTGIWRIADVLAADVCIGCGACAVTDPERYRIRFTKRALYQTQPVPAAASAPSSDPARVCPFSDQAENEDQIAQREFGAAPHSHPAVGRWTAAYVGWVEERDFRTRGSSGGMVSWLLLELLRAGEIDGVVHVAPRTPTKENPGLFAYRVSRTPEEIQAAAKSRYYPIEFSAALAEVRVRPGRYAFVGVPCFVKAVRLLMKNDAVLRERIALCLGLFCGHLKSAALVESFARQSGVASGSVAAVDFRVKQPDRGADVYTVGLTTRDGRVHVRDWARMVDGDWGMGFFQYEACNFCDDVMAETADVSFGDAWVKPYSADGRGTNVVVIRAERVREIFAVAAAEGRLELREVDGEFLAKTQAAGLRQRREGLAYRLHRSRGERVPRKRVKPNAHAGGWKRRRIYDLRRAISFSSHRVFAAARTLRCFWIYRAWARAMGALYRSVYWLDRGSVRARLLGRLR